MKLEIFNHIFPRRFFDRMVEVAPKGVDMHQRVRAIPCIVDAAIETGLLEMLAENPISGKEVSRQMNIPGKRGYYWLQLLTELGILEKESRGYVPSVLAHSAILDVEDFLRLRTKHGIADERERLAGVRNTALYFREPTIWKAQGLTEPKGYVEQMNADPERAYAFTHLLYNIHQKLGHELAEYLDMAGVHDMLDIGGGSGVEAMAFARKYPRLNITTVDIENVCVIGRKIVEENQLSDRITFFPADFLTDELPRGFDFVLHCDVGVYGEEQFRKLWTSLKPDGDGIGGLALFDHLRELTGAGLKGRGVFACGQLVRLVFDGTGEVAHLSVLGWIDNLAFMDRTAIIDADVIDQLYQLRKIGSGQRQAGQGE